MKARLNTRPEILSASLKLIAATVVALVATLGVTAEPASAYYASEIGPYEAPNVTCDSFTNRISVAGVFGVGAAYNTTQGQYLSVRYYAVNVNRNESFWITPNGTWHQPFVGLGWTGYMWWKYATNVPEDWADVVAVNLTRFSAEPFDVYAQYAWWTSDGWITRTAKRSAYSGSCYL